MNYYTRDRVLTAGRQLGLKMIHAAARLAKDVGFSYEPVPWNWAPGTLAGMRQAVNKSQTTRCPYPVWVGASDSTVFDSVEANWSFRFVHDMTHVATGKDAGFEDEMKVHSKMAHHLGLPVSPDVRDGLTARIYWVDTAGQSFYHFLHGRHVEDQVDFACRALANWDAYGTLAEAVKGLQ